MFDLHPSTIKNAYDEKWRCRELSWTPCRVRIDIARSAPISLLHCKGTGFYNSDGGFWLWSYCGYNVEAVYTVHVNSFIGNPTHLPVLSVCRALVAIWFLEQIQLMIFLSIIPRPSFFNLCYDCLAFEMLFLHLSSDVLRYLPLFGWMSEDCRTVLCLSSVLLTWRRENDRTSTHVSALPVHRSRVVGAVEEFWQQSDHEIW